MLRRRTGGEDVRRAATVSIERDLPRVPGRDPDRAAVGREGDVVGEEGRGSVRTSFGRRALLASSTATLAAAVPRAVQIVRPSGLIEMCRAGPGTRVRQSTRAPSVSSTTTSSLAESVMYASWRFGWTAV